MSSIAIVGKGAKKRIEADEVWGFNPPGRHYDENHFDSYTRWFELHTLDTHLERRPEYVTEFLKTLPEKGVPVEIMDVESARPLWDFFPEQRIREEFPKGWYHCSTVDWLIARAILELVPNEGPGESYGDGHTILLAGMYFGGNEPDSARACAEFWAGIAEGMGIRVETQDCRAFLINAQRETWDGEWNETREAYGLDVANFTGNEDSTRAIRTPPREGLIYGPGE